MNKFKTINHTADVGIIAYGKTLRELFENASYGMFSIMVDTFDKIRQKVSVRIKAEGQDYESLLVNYLSEFIYLCATKKLIFRKFKIDNFGDFYLNCTAKGERISAQKHKLNFEIKAATYHNLKIQQSSEGTYYTQIIFDV